MKGFAKFLINEAHKLIHSESFCNMYKVSEKYFTRLRCMGFGMSASLLHRKSL